MAKNICSPNCGLRFRHKNPLIKRMICALGNFVERRECYDEWPPDFEKDQRPNEEQPPFQSRPKIDFVFGPLCEARPYQEIRREYERGLNNSAFFSTVRNLDVGRDFVSADLSGREDDKRTYRAFATFEIENNPNRKYMLGSIFNAAALGYVAVVITGNAKSFSCAFNIKKYMRNLEARRKWYFGNNVFIISSQKFEDICVEIFREAGLTFEH